MFSLKLSQFRIPGFLLLFATTASSQSLDELQHRLSAQQARLSIALEAKQIADSMRLENSPVSTFKVGPISVMSAESQIEVVRSLVEEVWQDFEAVVGQPLPTFQFGFFFEKSGQSGEAIYMPPEGWMRLRVDPTDRNSSMREIRNAIGGQLTLSLPSELREFISNVPLPIERSPNWRKLYSTIVMTPSIAARDCYQGGNEACWAAVGASAEGFDWRTLYSTTDLQGLVRTRYQTSMARGPGWYGGNFEELRAKYDDCLNSHERGGCISLIDRRGRPVDTPFGFDIRADLFHVALEQGGRGAYRRALDADESDIKTILAAVSELDADVLMEEWRTNIIDERSSRSRNPLKSTALSGFWLGVFGLIAIRRGRWS